MNRQLETTATNTIILCVPKADRFPLFWTNRINENDSSRTNVESERRIEIWSSVLIVLLYPIGHLVDWIHGIFTVSHFHVFTWFQSLTDSKISGPFAFGNIELFTWCIPCVNHRWTRYNIGSLTLPRIVKSGNTGNNVCHTYNEYFDAQNDRYVCSIPHTIDTFIAKCSAFTRTKCVTLLYFHWMLERRKGLTQILWDNGPAYCNRE